MTQEKLMAMINETGDEYLNAKKYNKNFTELANGLTKNIVGVCFESFKDSDIEWRDVMDFHSTVAAEECSELAQAISKLHRAYITDTLDEHKDSIFNAEEEIADVIMNIHRIISLYNLDVTNIEKILFCKLKRYNRYAYQCYEAGKLID